MPDPVKPSDADVQRLLAIEQNALASIAWIRAFRVTGATFSNSLSGGASISIPPPTPRPDPQQFDWIRFKILSNADGKGNYKVSIMKPPTAAADMTKDLTAEAFGVSGTADAYFSNAEEIGNDSNFLTDGENTPIGFGFIYDYAPSPDDETVFWPVLCGWSLSSVDCSGGT